MSSELINETRQSYRRGLVLGFTVAEALLLILFGILLALGSIIVTKNQERDELKAELNRAQPKLAAIDTLKASFPSDAEQTFDDFFGELTLAIEQRDRAQAKLASLTEKVNKQQRDLEELHRTKRIVERASENGKSSADALQESAARGEVLNEVFPSEVSPDQVQQVLNIAKQLEELLPPAESAERQAAEDAALKEKADIEAMRKALEDAERAQDRLEGQLANASRRLKQDGLGYPACWARKVGTPDYIFDIALRPDGIVIYDNALPRWEAEQEALPLSSSMYDQPLSSSQFRMLTKPLFDTSEARDCRFFVQIYDMTGPQDKLRYKQLMQAVESHFYKYEVSNRSTWKGPRYSAPQSVAQESHSDDASVQADGYKTQDGQGAPTSFEIDADITGDRPSTSPPAIPDEQD
ncbi:hypothetical protein WNY37_05605 [Henriciella sp. AS95]|uniref:hypothetical protein n=1 Tax=Henriciella sp. AS95 TaxID=3135782 RepID=UPI0031748973